MSLGTAYDPNGNPLTVTETYTGTPISRTTVHTYDAFDRMESVTDRFGLTLSYTYDANGNRRTLQDPAGAITRYTYDALNRLTAVATGTGVAIYDYYLDSRRKKVSYPNASFETVTYDAAARVQSVENRQSATAVLSRFDYLYDKNGNRTQQVETRGNPAVAETTTYSYDAADRLTAVVYPEKRTVYTLDGVGDRLTERATSTAGGALTDLTSTYNTRHQLTTIVDGLNASNSVAYTYDANGNQLTRTPEDPDALSEQLGVEPKVGQTPDGTIRMTWKPNADTEIRFESHPGGLSPENPGFNPRHHGPHYHVTTKPTGTS